MSRRAAACSAIPRKSSGTWLKLVNLHYDAPLTPALSPSEGERENLRQSAGESRIFEKSGGESDAVEVSGRRTLLFPLPIRWGEGQGVGEFIGQAATQRFRSHKDVFESQFPSLAFSNLWVVQGENSPKQRSRFEPRNRSAAVSQTSRSMLKSAAAGFQHSRAPVHGEGLVQPHIHE
jgi:hypothetical protein